MGAIMSSRVFMYLESRARSFEAKFSVTVPASHIRDDKRKKISSGRDEAGLRRNMGIALPGYPWVILPGKAFEGLQQVLPG